MTDHPMTDHPRSLFDATTRLHPDVTAVKYDDWSVPFPLIPAGPPVAGKVILRVPEELLRGLDPDELGTYLRLSLWYQRGDEANLRRIKGGVHVALASWPGRHDPGADGRWSGPWPMMFETNYPPDRKPVVYFLYDSPAGPIYIGSVAA